MHNGWPIITFLIVFFAFMFGWFGLWLNAMSLKIGHARAVFNAETSAAADSEASLMQAFGVTRETPWFASPTAEDVRSHLREYWRHFAERPYLGSPASPTHPSKRSATLRAARPRRRRRRRRRPRTATRRRRPAAAAAATRWT